MYVCESEQRSTFSHNPMVYRLPQTPRSRARNACCLALAGAGWRVMKRRRLHPNEPEFEEVTKRARVQNKDQGTSAAHLEDTLVVVPLRE